ncbi:unnamed protein product [Eruca vesicaria subsp. sativa]|uniref:GYF domain-containing protein n=1 Tax=Eruca vesicaria subsp. sativa TaxID=29727 RepID=A0ABC8IVZ6_ERUVS|nr:unnamed protein product [Eruca vesicaria subsp. sativa]
MEDHTEKAKPLSKKRFKKPKSLNFIGWGSKNLIDFLQSLGNDTTDEISEYEVTNIVRKYIRELNVVPLKKAKNKKKTKIVTCDEKLTFLFGCAKINTTKLPDLAKNKKKTKIVTCDEKLTFLFGCAKINTTKLPDLVAKHYVENQEEDEDFKYLYTSDDGDDKERLCFKEVVEKKRKGSVVAAIVRDNVKLLYLRKSLVMELAKRSESFESKVLGSFVRIKNPCRQLVHVTGVKEGNPIDGYFLQVTNYCYYLEDVASSALSDDDFTQEECEELQQRIKNGSVKKLTVVEMEEKVRSLHEDVTKHYLDRRELLSNPEEQSRLLLEVPEVIAEEVEPESVDVDVNNEDEFMEPNPEASIETHHNDSPVSGLVKAQEIPQLCDEEEEEDQPPWAVSAGDKDLLEDVEELPEDGMITQNNKDSIFDESQAQANAPVIIELSDDDEEEEEEKGDYKKYDPKKKMWCYELPKGQTHGPFSLEELKEWSDQEYFIDFPDFSVFMTGNSIGSGVLLTKLLAHIKP